MAIQDTLMENFLSETRKELGTYFETRNLIFSNTQLFAFILVSPITIAIASDENLDFTEVTMLVDIASYLEGKSLPTALDNLVQPLDTLPHSEFNKIIYSELRFLCLNMKKYESKLIRVLKKLIELDETISQSEEYSIKSKIKNMMESVIYNNLGRDSIEEEKVKLIYKKLNI